MNVLKPYKLTQITQSLSKRLLAGFDAFVESALYGVCKAAFCEGRVSAVEDSVALFKGRVWPLPSLSQAERADLDLVVSVAQGWMATNYAEVSNAYLQKIALDLRKSKTVLDAVGNSARVFASVDALDAAFDRAIDVAVNDAYQFGRVHGFLRFNAERDHVRDPYLFKHLPDDPNAYQVVLYRQKTNPLLPVAMRYSEWRENGVNNLHRSANAPETTDWLPVIGSTHAYDRSEIVPLPEGFLFTDDGKIVSRNAVRFV